MTVAELIEKLREMPQDLPVIVGAHDTYEDPCKQEPDPRYGYSAIGHDWWFQGEYAGNFPEQYERAVIL